MIESEDESESVDLSEQSRLAEEDDRMSSSDEVKDKVDEIITK